MTGPRSCSSSPRVQRRRLIDLEQHPRALDGLFVPGAAVVGDPPDPRVDADLYAPLRAAERLAAMPRATVALVPARGGGQPARTGDARPGTRSCPQRYVELSAACAREHAARPAVAAAAGSRAAVRLPAGRRRHVHGHRGAAGARDRAPSTPRWPLCAIDLDDDLVAGYRAGGVTDEMRLALLLGVPARTGAPAAPGAHRPGPRPDPGQLPVLRRAPGRAVHPGRRRRRRPSTTRSARSTSSAAPLVHERIAWVPDGAAVEVAADGVGRPARRRGRRAGPPATAASSPRTAGIAGRVAGDLRIRRSAARSAVTARYEDAWLLMDRDTAAQDNAEHLYRYLRGARADVNAWFVLARPAPTGTRLEREGFRLLAYGSARALRRAAATART